MAWPFDGDFEENHANILAREPLAYVKEPGYPAHFDYLKVALAVSFIRYNQGKRIGLDYIHPDLFLFVQEVAGKKGFKMF